MMINRAAELGPKTFAWWPDWRGECCAIIASGPSTKKMQPQILKDRVHVIAIKETIDLVPFADCLYGCDGPWWLYRNGMPQSPALKFSWAAEACARFNLHKVEIVNKAGDELLFEKPLSIGAGGNSGFQALNLAIQFGAENILLVGFDMNDRKKEGHYYGRNRWPMANNPTTTNFKRWKDAFGHARKQMDELGVEAIVISDDSDLACFERNPDLPAVLERWGL